MIRVLFMLFPLLTMSCPTNKPISSSKFMFYNILYGGQDRLDRIKSYIKIQQIDFLALSELNHWNQDQLQQFGEELDMPHTYFLTTNTGYHLGIASRYSLKIISKSTKPNWHHGFLYVHIQKLDISIFVTHLSPHSSQIRQWEASHVLKARVQKMPLLVLGDLNTLSPLDVTKHSKLREIFLSDNRLKKKFLNTNNDIDYVPMEILLSELHDTSIQLQATVPTQLTEDFMHAASMRLDYALSSEKDVFFGYADINEETEMLSDHYPIIVQKCEKEVHVHHVDRMNIVEEL